MHHTHTNKQNYTHKIDALIKMELTSINMMVYMNAFIKKNECAASHFVGNGHKYTVLSVSSNKTSKIYYFV